MMAGFGYSIYGIGNLFVDKKSKDDYKHDKEEEVMKSVYTLRGNTKFKLLVRIMDHNWLFVLDKGNFNINFPWVKDGKFEEIVQY